MHDVEPYQKFPEHPSRGKDLLGSIASSKQCSSFICSSLRKGPSRKRSSVAPQQCSPLQRTSRTEQFVREGTARAVQGDRSPGMFVFVCETATIFPVSKTLRVANQKIHLHLSILHPLMTSYSESEHRSMKFVLDPPLRVLFPLCVLLVESRFTGAAS